MLQGRLRWRKNGGNSDGDNEAEEDDDEGGENEEVMEGMKNMPEKETRKKN
jgi:hypothetical protein